MVFNVLKTSGDRKRIISVCSLFLMLLFFLPACQSRFVGMRIPYNIPLVCRCPSGDLPKKCGTATGIFGFEFEVSKGEKEGEYIINGEAVYLGTPGTRLARGKGGGSRFFLLLAKNGVITDTMALNLSGNDLDRPLPFRKTFSSPSSFDALAITYRVTVVE